MITNKIKNYIEQIDPYYTQRIILHQGLYIATLLTIVNILALPDAFSPFAVTAILLSGIYTSQEFTTYKEKEKALVFMFIMGGFSGFCFYMLFHFKVILIFFAISYFIVFYFFCDRYYPKFRPFVLQSIVPCVFTMRILPSGSLQTGIDAFFCIMLTLMVVFVGFKTHPNMYPYVWQRSFGNYLKIIETEVGHTINKSYISSLAEKDRPINIIRSYKRLLPQNIILNVMRATIAMRNIQFALDYAYKTEKNKEFWVSFKYQVAHYHASVIKKERCLLEAVNEHETEFTQDYVIHNLNKSIRSWNKICDLI